MQQRFLESLIASLGWSTASFCLMRSSSWEERCVGVGYEQKVSKFSQQKREAKRES